MRREPTGEAEPKRSAGAINKMTNTLDRTKQVSTEQPLRVTKQPHKTTNRDHTQKSETVQIF